GVIGAVGDAFGKNKINIADMTISRQDDLAMMVIKVDTQPSPAVLQQLAQIKQIRKVFAIYLPELSEQS
ncbi:MAG: ACT domain-containing protein, partial [Phycisphaerae bacterium]|nr:ACT domain-containing protein [Phycisphaerae bacterium]